MSQRVDTILLLMSSLFFGCIENVFFFSFLLVKRGYHCENKGTNKVSRHSLLKFIQLKLKNKILETYTGGQTK